MQYPSLNERGIGTFYFEEVITTGDAQRADYIPHLAGVTALGVSYAAAAGLTMVPHPLAKTVAAGILLVPDIAIYAAAYSVFD